MEEVSDSGPQNDAGDFYLHHSEFEQSLMNELEVLVSEVNRMAASDINSPAPIMPAPINSASSSFSASTQLRNILSQPDVYRLMLDKDSRIINISDNYLKLFKLGSRESVIGLKCYEVFKCTKIECASCPVPEALSTRHTLSMMEIPESGPFMERMLKTVITPFGDDNGFNAGVMVSVSDVSGMQKLKLSLIRMSAAIRKNSTQMDVFMETISKSQQHEPSMLEALEFAARNITDGIYICGKNHKYANRAFCEFNGCTEKNLPDFQELTKDLIESNGLENENLDDAKIIKGIQSRNDKDTSPLELDVSVLPFKIAESRYYLVIQKDITEKILMERRLFQAQKMESLGVTASGIAHDFNNIIMIIMANAEMALELYRDNPDSVQTYSERIIRSCIRARNMVARISAFSRRSDFKRQPIYFNKAVRESVNIISPLLPENFAIKIDLYEKDAVVISDHTEIQQLVMNLCLNAVQAGAGKLEISSERVVLSDAKASSGNLKPGTYFKIVFKDDGDGIDHKDIKHIFETFFSKGRDGRTGMGLSVIQRIIGELGGDIQAHSESRKGTSFTILIPCLNKIPAKFISEDESSMIERNGISGRGESILIFDSDPELLESIREFLCSINYVAHGFTSCGEALAYLRKNLYSVDAVIADGVSLRFSEHSLREEFIRLAPTRTFMLFKDESILPDDELNTVAAAMLLKPLSNAELAKSLSSMIRSKENIDNNCAMHL